MGGEWRIFLPKDKYTFDDVLTKICNAFQVGPPEGSKEIRSDIYVVATKELFLLGDSELLTLFRVGLVAKFGSQIARQSIKRMDSRAQSMCFLLEGISWRNWDVEEDREAEYKKHWP